MELYKSSSVWVVDFHFDGRPRRWFKAFGPGVDVREQMAAQLLDLHGGRAVLLDVRPATADEELQYLRGDTPKNMLCPTGRHG